jgi:acetyl-CoA acetyltransferase
VALIVGVADTQVGVVPDLSATELYALAIRNAVADAGATVHDIDFLVTGNSREFPFLHHAEVMAEYMGIRPERCITQQTGGATTIHAVALANAAIEAGDSKLAVIALADSLASGMGRSNAIESMSSVSHPLWEQLTRRRHISRRARAESSSCRAARLAGIASSIPGAGASHATAPTSGGCR